MKKRSLKPTFTSMQVIGMPLNNLRILVVDDNEYVAESLVMLLEIDGHQVMAAPDGRTAIEMALAELPEVILLDIGLPGMNGYSVAKVLRHSSQLQNTLLLALTGYGLPDDLEKSRRAGFDKHLVKPIDYATLRQLLVDYQTSLASGFQVRK